MPAKIDAAFHETAQDFASSQAICAYFAEQCWSELDRRIPVLALTELAADLWGHHGQQVPAVAEALQALFDERLRHDAAIVELSNRLAALAEKEMPHLELTPIEPIALLIKSRLLEAAARAVAPDDELFEAPPPSP